MTRRTALARVTSAGRRFVDNRKKGVTLIWVLADALLVLRSTYAQGDAETKAFYAAGATAAGIDESSVRTYVNAAETKATLTEPHAKATAAWPVDSMIVLRGVKNADRTKIIGKATKANAGRGTTNTKDIRGFKRDVLGTQKRNRKNDEDRKIELAGKLKDRVQKAIDAGHSITSLIAGAQMAKDNAGEDVAPALIFLQAQVTKATPVVK